jgi:pimeloyl-ACP methyl ester carboxylesterase
MAASAGTPRHRQIDIGGADIHVVEVGDPDAAPFVFVHGWPESSRTWHPLMTLAAEHVHAVALDLPGIGQSSGPATDGSKRALAEVVHGLIGTLGRDDVTLVGHDIGGMVVYAYLRAFDDIARAVIMDVPVPGVPPWDEFVREPYLWHFALHSVGELPEALVRGRQREYFDYFYDLLSGDSTAITADARTAYAVAYADDTALTAGFDWYRAFGRDVEENRRTSSGPPARRPLLYLRGEQERGGDIDDYVEGFRHAGVRNVHSGLVSGAKHFVQEESPEVTWRLIADFAQRDDRADVIRPQPRDIHSTARSWW